MTLQEYKKEIFKYYFSGELNFKIDNIGKVIQTLLEKYSDAEIDTMDGYRFNYSDWWFLVRMANTEPILRLVVEGKSETILKERVNELKSFIHNLGGLDHLS